MSNLRPQNKHSRRSKKGMDLEAQPRKKSRGKGPSGSESCSRNIMITIIVLCGLAAAVLFGWYLWRDTEDNIPTRKPKHHNNGMGGSEKGDNGSQNKDDDYVVTEQKESDTKPTLNEGETWTCSKCGSKTSSYTNICSGKSCRSLRKARKRTKCELDGCLMCMKDTVDWPDDIGTSEINRRVTAEDDPHFPDSKYPESSKSSQPENPGSWLTNSQIREYFKMGYGEFRLFGPENNDPRATDIAQGGIGCCYLYSTMGLIGEMHPLYVRKIIRESPKYKSCYEVRIAWPDSAEDARKFAIGKAYDAAWHWEYILVNRQLPKALVASYVRKKKGRNPRNTSFWWLYLMKAVAKKCGSGYRGLEVSSSDKSKRRVPFAPHGAYGIFMKRGAFFYQSHIEGMKRYLQKGNLTRIGMANHEHMIVGSFKTHIDTMNPWNQSPEKAEQYMKDRLLGGKDNPQKPETKGICTGITRFTWSEFSSVKADFENCPFRIIQLNGRQDESLWHTAEELAERKKHH